nr:gastrula zinc finger protein XlCGF7.1-like [Rhipicephalus microplus]
MLQDIHEASSKGCQTSLPMTRMQETQTPSNLRTRDCGTTTHPMFFCKDCGGTFVTALRLHWHSRTSHPNKLLPCTCFDCSRSPSNRNQVKMHERPFTCYICQKGFFRADDVEKHMRVHTREAASPSSAAARKHERIVHARDYPHYCPHCGKGLANKNKLEKHIRGRHFEFEMVDSDEDGGSVMQTVKTK